MKDQEVIDFGYDKYLKELAKKHSFVDVGVIGKKASKKHSRKKGSSDITMAELASVQEFGAVIDHPGGTAFGFKSKAGAERGEVRFLKKGKGFVSGVTGPHQITIPPRPFIRQTFDENLPELGRKIDDLHDQIIVGKITKKKALTEIGQTHQNQIQDAMKTKGNFVDNAPSTIRNKKSATPLIDTGALRQAINFEVG